MQIGTLPIGPQHPPVIVAELSGNHNQSLDRAMLLVEQAAAAGAQALKLQTYTADTITLDVASRLFTIEDAGSPWAGQTLHRLYQVAYTPWEWHPALFQKGRELGLQVFSSPFDESAVDFLEGLGCPCYKIASFENNHLPLIRKAASTGKPLIISTGLASLGELSDAVEAARAAGCHQLMLLKCTSAYPADPGDMNLRTIPHMKTLFDLEVGLSDHSLGIEAAVASVALGASLIEKHLTISRAEGGVDASFSLEPAELAELVRATRNVWCGLGGVRYGPTASETNSLQFRRSLFISRDLEAGEALSPENVRVVRPGQGLSPRFWEFVVGRKVRDKVTRGTPLSWDLLC